MDDLKSLMGLKTSDAFISVEAESGEVHYLALDKLVSIKVAKNHVVVRTTGYEDYITVTGDELQRLSNLLGE